MTWGSIKIAPDEMMIALRHRLVVITYFACWALIFPIRFRPDVPYLDIWRESLIFVTSQVVIIACIPISIFAGAYLQRARPTRTVYLSR